MSSSKTVLITGASRGIGFLTTKLLAEAGHTVFAAMRDLKGKNSEIAEGLVAWAKENALDIRPVELDVTDDISVAAAIETIEADTAIDVVINNAGVMPVGVTEAYTPEDITACLDVNLVGVARVCRATLPHMRKRKKGLLIHVSSNAGRLALPFFGLYCASKWALEAYAESMQYELQNFGIETTIVEPGGHATDLVANPPAPSDQNCVSAYGAVSEGPSRLIGMFESIFSQGEDINDAGNVAKKIVELVSAQAPLPMRVTVGEDMGVAQMNARVEDLQAGVMTALKPMVTFDV